MSSDISGMRGSAEPAQQFFGEVQNEPENGLRGPPGRPSGSPHQQTKECGAAERHRAQGPFCTKLLDVGRVERARQIAAQRAFDRRVEPLRNLFQAVLNQYQSAGGVQRS
jgi:hypothetical protein